MKHLKTFEDRFEKIVHRKVYWISTFEKNLEDSLVKLVTQFKGAKNDFEGIENIDYALGVASTARKNLKSNDFAIITMEFKMRDEEVMWGPSFEVYDIKEEKFLKSNDYIFVGFAPNTDKEKYEIYKTTQKYNI